MMTNSCHYDYHTFGGNLKIALERKGMGSLELARLLGKKRSYVSNLLEPGSNPTLKTVAIIANALDVPVESLIRSEKCSVTSLEDEQNIQTQFMEFDPEDQSLVLEVIKLIQNRTEKSKLTAKHDQ